MNPTFAEAYPKPSIVPRDFAIQKQRNPERR